ncbi:MAG TPA: phosphatase PAP2 family protein [Gemmatimonadaceae bacterium]|nr:phosphatase PAP2 family protein [Gemmatimonadaceae bacterium]
MVGFKVSGSAGPVLRATAPGGPVYAADGAAQRVLQSSTLQQNRVLRASAAVFNWWGGPGVILVAAVLWLGARAARRRRISALGLRCAEAIAVSSAISGIIKGLAGRARPFVTPGEPWHWQLGRGWAGAHYYSMPSGHTTAAFALAGAATVTLARGAPPYRAAIATVAVLSALLVAFARMYSNQHWLSDEVVGTLLGMSTGVVIARWHARHPESAFDRALLGTADA